MARFCTAVPGTRYLVAGLYSNESKVSMFPLLITSSFVIRVVYCCRYVSHALCVRFVLHCLLYRVVPGNTQENTTPPSEGYPSRFSRQRGECNRRAGDRQDEKETNTKNILSCALCLNLAARLPRPWPCTERRGQQDGMLSGSVRCAPGSVETCCYCYGSTDVLADARKNN